MIVIDASVLANVVGDDGPAGDLARSRLRDEGDAAVPDLADVETAAVLRRRWLAGDLDDARFLHAIEDLVDLPFVRVPVGPLLRRGYELRENVTAYDACYVGLAERLGCALVTADARLSRASGVRCAVEVLALS